MRQTTEHRHKFVWTRIKTPEELGQVRLAAMTRFLADYDIGKRGMDAMSPASCRIFRFKVGMPMTWPFVRISYSCILTSNARFSSNAIEEMCRVAHEARIFPATELQCDTFAVCGADVERIGGVRGTTLRWKRFPYEFQRGGNQMLRVRKAGIA